MKPTARVESAGSVWLFDETVMTYLRMPKQEGPRENGWGGPDQGPLEDLRWLPYVDWWITDEGRLRIECPDGLCVTAPSAEVVA